MAKRKSRHNGNESKKRTSEPLAQKIQSSIKRYEQQEGSPFEFMRRFSEDMGRLFEDFGFGRSWLAPEFQSGLDRLGTLATGTWAPQVEVVERDNQMIVRADLPGMSRDDISIDIDDSSLVIRGERKSERKENEEGYYRTERSYGSFARRIPLPAGVNAEEASADFTDGVLEITMPAPKKGEPRRRSLSIAGTGEHQSRAKAKSAGQNK